MNRLARSVVAGLMVTVLGASACTGSDGDEDDVADRISATLEIITTNIQTAAGDDGFRESEAGEKLTVGDRVKTDDTGFAELSYHDGSWQRVENNATLTIEDLSEVDEARTVGTSVDIGRTWNRVRELSEPEDGYEVETPVATASVRGTIFSTDCPTKDACTFRVIEGTIVITPLVGDPVTMEAPSLLEVTADEEPGEPTVLPPDVLRQDPWVVKNLGEDRERIREQGDENGNDEEALSELEPDDEQLRVATLEGAYDAVRTGVSSNYQANHPNYVAPGESTERTYDVAPDCVGVECVLALEIDGSGAALPMTFDGTDYVQREELVSDCIDDATRQPIATGVARIVAEVRWTPTDAQLVDGEWTVTEFTGTVRHFTEVLKPEEFTERCYWPTTDGAQPAQEVTAEASRR